MVLIHNRRLVRIMLPLGLVCVAVVNVAVERDVVSVAVLIGMIGFAGWLWLRMTDAAWGHVGMSPVAIVVSSAVFCAVVGVSWAESAWGAAAGILGPILWLPQLRRARRADDS